MEGNINFRAFISTLSVFSPGGDAQQKMQYAFDIYDIDGDGFISQDELQTILKMMVGTNLDKSQMSHIVEKTIMEADHDGDGKLSFTEFSKVMNLQEVAEKMTIKFE